MKEEEDDLEIGEEETEENPESGSELDDNEKANNDSLSDDDDDDDEIIDEDEYEDKLKFKDDENDNNILTNDETLFNITKNDYDVDLENNDSMEFLQKFTKEYRTDYILNNHQESLNKNYEEIKKLIIVTKDNDNNIIDAFHKTIPILTKYEKTKIIGIRLKQLNNGAKPYITVSDTILDNNIIVDMELKQKALPFIISRPLPNNTCEYWKLQDLELL